MKVLDRVGDEGMGYSWKRGKGVQGRFWMSESNYTKMNLVTYRFQCVHKTTRSGARTRKHVITYTDTHAHIYIHKQAYKHTHAHTYPHTNIQTHTRIHIHTKTYKYKRTHNRDPQLTHSTHSTHLNMYQGDDDDVDDDDDDDDYNNPLSNTHAHYFLTTL